MEGDLARSPAGDRWPIGPPRPIIAPDEVHVWPADLLGADLAALAAALVPDERQRADRYHRAVDRDRFVADRGVVRDLLGRYLDRPPAQVRFGHGPFGKPALLAGDEPDRGRLRSNLALGGGLARPFAAIEVTSRADSDIAIGDPREPSAALWRIRDLAPAADDVAALATPSRAGPGWHSARFSWSMAEVWWAGR